MTEKAVIGRGVLVGRWDYREQRSSVLTLAHAHSLSARSHYDLTIAKPPPKRIRVKTTTPIQLSPNLRANASLSFATARKSPVGDSLCPFEVGLRANRAP